MNLSPMTECACGCNRRIGTNPYLLATDGINGKMVAFLKEHDPRDPDLQRHHKTTLAPINLGFATKGLS